MHPLFVNFGTRRRVEKAGKMLMVNKQICYRSMGVKMKRWGCSCKKLQIFTHFCVHTISKIEGAICGIGGIEIVEEKNNYHRMSIKGLRLIEESSVNYL
jgi:hypothetical protein